MGTMPRITAARGHHLHIGAFVSVTGLVRFLVLFDFSNHGAPPFLPISDHSPHKGIVPTAPCFGGPRQAMPTADHAW